MNQDRILLVSVATVLGGAEIYLERLTEVLVHKAPILAVCIHPIVARRLRLAGAKVIQLPELFGARINRVLKYPVALCVVIYLIVTRRIQTAHLNGYHSCFLAVPARLLGCFTLITPHHMPTARFTRLWYVATARWVHCAINVSEFADAQHRSVLPHLRTVVIRNWIPHIPNHPGARSFAATPRVLFVGRLVVGKGLPDLLDAVKLLQGNVELVVAGEGPLRAEWEALSASLPVRFVGFREDLSALYREADALIVPSHDAEASCLAALEAMAHGVPCVMSDLPAYREIARDGATALLYPVGDFAALAAAIRRVTCDREFAAKLAANARNMVMSQYTFEMGYSASLQVFGFDPAPCGDRVGRPVNIACDAPVNVRQYLGVGRWIHPRNSKRV